MNAMSIPTGNIAESPEALEVQRAQEADDIQLDEKYSDPQVLKDEQAEANKSLYGSAFQAPEKSPQADSTEQVQESISDQEHISESIHSPFIDKCAKEGKLTFKEAIIAKQTVYEAGTIESLDSIPKEELSTEKKEKLTEALNYVESPENTEKFQTKFQEDFGTEFGDFQNEKGEFISERDKSACELIAGNYTVALEGNVSPTDKKVALDSAFETAFNIEIENKQFPRTEEFKECSKQVKDDSLPISERFKAFIDMQTIVDTDQGAKGGRRVLDKLVAKKRNALKSAGLEEQYEQAQVALQESQKTGDKKAYEVAQAKIDETLENAEELSSGDMGNFDTALEVGGTEQMKEGKDAA